MANKNATMQRGLRLILPGPPDPAAAQAHQQPHEDATRDSTGLAQVWQEATDCLCDYIEGCSALLFPGCREPADAGWREVLELGAGAGVCGMFAARCGAARVVLSDYHTAVLAALRYNVGQNDLEERCEVVSLPWGEAPGPGPGVPRLIIGSDLAPSDATARLLGATVARLLDPAQSRKHAQTEGGSVFLYAHRERHAVYLDRQSGAVRVEVEDSAFLALRAALAPHTCRQVTLIITLVLYL